MLPSGCLNNIDVCLKGFHSVAELWFGRLSLATKVVAVGVFFEAPELIFEIWAIARRKYERWKLHITFPERHAPDWVKVVAFVGWFLIVGGVVGEWYAEDKVNEADVAIQELNGIQLADAEYKANSAITDAVAITEKFGGLHAFVEAKEREADNQFAAFKRYTDAENKRTEAVIAELNSDRQKLDKARTDAVTAANEAKEVLAAVTAARQPRHLTPDQQRTIAQKMAAWTKIPNSSDGVQDVAVYPSTGTFESTHLADEIAAALARPPGAGWGINRNAVNFGSPMMVLGVGIFTSSNSRGQAVAAALAKALNEEGILAFVIPQKWKGCEDNKITEHPDTEPYCSLVSVIVGDHP